MMTLCQHISHKMAEIQQRWFPRGSILSTNTSSISVAIPHPQKIIDPEFPCSHNEVVARGFLKKVSSFSAAALDIVKLLLSAYIKNPRRLLRHAQRTIGRLTGHARETVCRATTELDEAGIITKIYVHRSTCFYVLNPLLFHPLVRAFLYKANSLLQSIINALQIIPTKVSHTIYKEGYISNNLRISCNTRLPRGWGHKVDFLYKKEVEGLSMMLNRPGEEFISRVEKSMGYKLSIAGKIKLSLFDDIDLEHGLRIAQAHVDSGDTVANTRKSFSNLFTSAWKHADERGHKVNWPVAYELARQYKIDLAKESPIIPLVEPRPSLRDQQSRPFVYTQRSQERTSYVSTASTVSTTPTPGSIVGRNNPNSSRYSYPPNTIQKIDVESEAKRFEEIKDSLDPKARNFLSFCGISNPFKKP